MNVYLLFYLFGLCKPNLLLYPCIYILNQYLPFPANF